MDDTVFITVHATAATAAFIAGLLSGPSGRFLRLYLGSLAVAAAALVPAVLVDWGSTDAVERIVFGGLFGLALVMLLRAGLALRRRPARTGGPTAAYLDHLGFTLISLADGFAVVAVIRSGAPGWLVAAVAVGVAATGHLALQAAKRQLVRQPDGEARRAVPRPV